MKHLLAAGVICLSAFVGLGQGAQAMQLGAARSVAGGELPVINVQETDAGRIGQLEETVRSLNGRIEEMSFQLLQMQEQIRKFQEDNEFRFQDLEKGKAPGKSGALERPAGTTGQDTASSEGAAPLTNDDIARVIDPNAGTDPNAGIDSTTGAPPTTLGSIEFDANGNPVGATAEAQPDPNNGVPGVETGANSGLNTNPATEQQTAALDNPDDLYQAAYTHVLSGDYSLAETGFRDYLTAFPEGQKAADASFWMGEAQYSQGKFNESAKTFLNAHQTYGTSSKAPEMLLKLGMSLAALDNKDTACATMREVTKRYPKASAAVKAKVASEQSRLAC
ncbi:tol-pal system protein YbgF [Pararhizobium sp.]|uniref:tol-pal system protein YbgF n=1 Tax=Pararhizobium sp. TaxID=1977563 RepID=UPI0027268EFF|nr:tol-pal system protein YbgF [Pararhizobium sp.]MDO9415103.1 tol-pal system protein YbgF [Pararhizobium sp.]